MGSHFPSGPSWCSCLGKVRQELLTPTVPGTGLVLKEAEEVGTGPQSWLQPFPHPSGEPQTWHILNFPPLLLMVGRERWEKASLMSRLVQGWACPVPPGVAIPSETPAHWHQKILFPWDLPHVQRAPQSLQWLNRTLMESLLTQLRPFPNLPPRLWEIIAQRPPCVNTSPSWDQASLEGACLCPCTSKIKGQKLLLARHWQWNGTYQS